MKLLTRIAALSALLLLSTVSLHAQSAGWANWWFGGGGGVNINMFNGALHDFSATDTGRAAPTGFNDGIGLGPNIHLLLEYNGGGTFGGGLTVGYDSRRVEFDQVTSNVETQTFNENGSVNLSYVSIEPSLRVNIINRFFHLLVGPTLGINVGKSYEYTSTQTSTGATTTATGEVANVRGFVPGYHVGLGYDIPLSGPVASPNVLLAPFAEFHGSTNLLDVPDGNRNDFSVATARVGLRLKFGSPTAVAPPPVLAPAATLSFAVRSPSVVVAQRTLSETFPLRNYIFFQEGQPAIPARYVTVSQSEAGTFREEQLVLPNANPGGWGDDMSSRSSRQMYVYYNVMNVFADRLRRTPGATITLSGSSKGNGTTGKEMAESVKNYMVTTFGIDPSRIVTEGRPWPEHRSGTGSSPAEDRAMIDEENVRVEVSAQPPSLLQPVKIESVQEAPIDNDVVVTVPTTEAMSTWRVEVTDPNGQIRTYGPYSSTRTVARLNSQELLGSAAEGRYTVRVYGVDASGQVIAADPQEFRLIKSSDNDLKAMRYSILFEFDESKTVETYREFLTGTVAPSIPNGSTVIIHGHTDVVGIDEHNQQLSQRRCEEAKQILQTATSAAGKTVTYDTYGFGEEEGRAPFGNSAPETRYYNRTVVIEVLPAP